MAQTAFQEQKEKLASRREEEKEIRSAPKPFKDERAKDLPWGEGRVDAAIFNGVHIPQNDGRPSVDTGHRLHSASIAAKSDEAKNIVPAAPVTSQGALAQDLDAARNTAPTPSADPVEVPHRDFPEVEDPDTTQPLAGNEPDKALKEPSPAGTGAKNEKAPVHSAKK